MRLARRPPSVIHYRGADARLTLRPPHPRDARALTDAVRESLPALRAFMPWAHGAVDIEAQYDRLVVVQAEYWRSSEFTYHLIDPADGRLLGCASLHGRQLNPRNLEIGYWVRSGAVGRGLATLAARCLVVVAFEHFGCDRVQIGANVANVASCRVIEKVGFVSEGLQRNYQDQGTPVLRAAGYAAARDAVAAALLPEDRPALPWYAAVRDALTIEAWDA